MKRWKRGIVGCVGALAIGVLAFGLFVYWLQMGFSFNRPFNDRAFDRKVWLANARNHDRHNPRGQMADDLTNKWLKKGMTRQDVVKLLGKPDPPEPNNPGVPKEGYEYNLGNWAWCSLCPDVLDIHFDKSGRLTSAEVTEH